MSIQPPSPPSFESEKIQISKVNKEIDALYAERYSFRPETVAAANRLGNIMVNLHVRKREKEDLEARIRICLAAYWESYWNAFWELVD